MTRNQHDHTKSENPISPQDPSSMPRAEDDDRVLAGSPEFNDRPGQGAEPPASDEEGESEKKREDWQQPTDPGSGRRSETIPSDLDDVEADDPTHPGRKPNPTGLQA